MFLLEYQQVTAMSRARTAEVQGPFISHYLYKVNIESIVTTHYYKIK